MRVTTGTISRFGWYCGKEFASRPLDQWAHNNGVELEIIRRGKPTENTFIESFNVRVREAGLNENQSVARADARIKVEVWWQEYNNERPHRAPGQVAPGQFARARTAEAGATGRARKFSRPGAADAGSGSEVSSVRNLR